MRTTTATRLGWLLVLAMAASLSAEPKKDASSKKNAVPNETSQRAQDLSCGVLAGESPASVKIEKALDEPTEMEFIEAPLTDVINFLRHRHSIEIQLDNKALEESGVATDTRITRNVKGISLRSALQLMLRDLELSYVIRDEVLLITTVANAESIAETRVYVVADLLRAHGQPTNSQSLAEQLKEVITNTVASTTWAEVGGAGAIKYWPGGESLVISQTYTVHRELCDFFVALRKSRGLQPSRPAEQAAVEQPDRLYVAVYRLPHRVRAMLEVESRLEGPAAAGGVRISPSRMVVEDLAQAIPKLVDPKSWQAKTDDERMHVGPESGGKGSGAAAPPAPGRGGGMFGLDGGNGSGGQGTIEIVGNELIVLQTAKVHQQIGEFLQTFAAANEITSGF